MDAFPCGEPLHVMVRLCSGERVKVQATDATTIGQLEAHVRASSATTCCLATLHPPSLLPEEKTLGELNLANTLLMQQARQ
jgi:hypothetical protein